jgi:hypothetical protein
MIGAGGVGYVAGEVVADVMLELGLDVSGDALPACLGDVLGFVPDGADAHGAYGGLPGGWPPGPPLLRHAEKCNTENPSGLWREPARPP